uniref:Ovule protein n=1 Tax=Steinernema glaseri TaxID=37863 RepID=A0A1I8A4R2_9BILA
MTLKVPNQGCVISDILYSTCQTALTLVNLDQPLGKPLKNMGKSGLKVLNPVASYVHDSSYPLDRSMFRQNPKSGNFVPWESDPRNFSPVFAQPNGEGSRSRPLDMKPPRELLDKQLSMGTGIQRCPPPSKKDPKKGRIELKGPIQGYGTSESNQRYVCFLLPFFAVYNTSRSSNVFQVPEQSNRAREVREALLNVLIKPAYCLR